MQLSRDCERLATNVPDPEVTLRTNPKRAVDDYAVALGNANDNITGTRECQARQRQRFSKGK